MIEPRRVNELQDELAGPHADLKNVKLVDFLKWAYSDLCYDANKGIFAEWLVAKILGIPTERRIAWSDYDLLSPNKTKIEVKSGSYWQSWKAINSDGTEADRSRYVIQPDSKIVFSRLAAKDTPASQNGPKLRYKSDVYIFCFQHEKDYLKWNAMDISQWEFYLVPVDALKTQSVNLRWLKAGNFGPLDPDGLIHRFQECEDSRARLSVG